jgi:hypothetical protein
MRRITDKDLAGMVARLNRSTHSPETYMANGQVNVGHFHLDRAYGGVKLVRTCNLGGGITCPLSMGYETKRAAYDQINAYIRGIEAVQYGDIKP